MEFAPDGRLFVAQKGGQLRVISSTGTLLPTPFLSVSVNTSGERGLLGVTFDPNFASTRYVYIYYTASSNTRNRISRFTASALDPNVAEAGSEVILLDNISGASSSNHNGGAIHFGPDGKLYAAVGDNGTSNQSQDLGSLRGKMLRLNSNGTIPADNPFVGVSGARGEVWAIGLRNPFTFAFDPAPGPCGSTTSEKTPGRRSIPVRRQRTTVGRTARALRAPVSATAPTRPSPTPSTRTPTRSPS